MRRAARRRQRIRPRPSRHSSSERGFNSRFETTTTRTHKIFKEILNLLKILLFIYKYISVFPKLSLISLYLSYFKTLFLLLYLNKTLFVLKAFLVSLLIIIIITIINIINIIQFMIIKLY